MVKNRNSKQTVQCSVCCSHLNCDRLYVVWKCTMYTHIVLITRQKSIFIFRRFCFHFFRRIEEKNNNTPPTYNKYFFLNNLLTSMKCANQFGQYLPWRIDHNTKSFWPYARTKKKTAATAGWLVWIKKRRILFDFINFEMRKVQNKLIWP